MTRDERRLLAAINRWRRDGEPAVAPFRGYEAPNCSARIELPCWVDRFGGYYEGDEEVRVRRPDHLGRLPTYATEYKVRTVTEGVDVLCALGILPARFSSAFREGIEETMRLFAAGLPSRLGAAIREEIQAASR